MYDMQKEASRPLFACGGTRVPLPLTNKGKQCRIKQITGHKTQIVLFAKNAKKKE